MSKKHILVIIGCSLMMIGVVGLPNAYGIYYDEMCLRFNSARSTVTFHMTLFFLAKGLFAPLITVLIDKYGAKKVSYFGIIVTLISGLLMTYTTDILILNIAGFLKGVGICCTYYLLITMTITNWFNEHTGLITGIIFACSGISCAIVSPIFTNILVNYGFETSYLAITISIFVLSLGYPLLCPFKPEDVGLEPYGEKTSSNKVKCCGIKCDPKSIVFILVISVSFLSSIINYISPNLPSHGTNLGYTAEVGAYMLSMSMISNAASKLAIGFMIDTIGVVKASIIILVFSAVGMLGVTRFVGSETLLYVFSFLIGTSYSVNTVGMSALTSYVYKKEDYAKMYSKIQVVSIAFSSFTTTFISFLFDKTGGFKLPFDILGWITIISICLFILIEIFVKKEMNKKSI